MAEVENIIKMKTIIESIIYINCAISLDQENDNNYRMFKNTILQNITWPVVFFLWQLP